MARAMAQYNDLLKVAAAVTNRRTHLLVIFLLWLALASSAMLQQEGVKITSDHSSTYTGCVGGTSIRIDQKRLEIIGDYGDGLWGVNVTNYCHCNAIGIHLHCGSFAPNIVNPASLIVLGYDNCLINNGHLLSPLQTISFEYERLHPFPLSFRSANFQC
ncbi:hypothetical protein O6H91_Y072200 [Diphasiastrum complanatum]|nr:hypothetical protein O6H91_Y072200 [Diphasiastrum complanatum]